jgi:hypothetical protein
MSILINNWKLKELNGKYEIVSSDSIEYERFVFRNNGIPMQENNPEIIGNSTIIDWEKMQIHYCFNFDGIDDNEFIKHSLVNSKLREHKYIIIVYGHNQPAVKIHISDFFNDWEGFVRSTLWESTMFTEDYKLFIEITKDYYLHSNFKIMDKT